MAHVLTIKRGTTTVLDLLGGNIRARMEGWETKTGAPDEVIWETFELVGAAATNALYLAALYDIQEFISNARQYLSDKQYGNPCWLHFQAEGGAEVRSLIVDGELEMSAEGHLSAFLGDGGVGFVSLSLARMPWWEEVANTVKTSSAISVIGGTYTPTGINLGDLPGRINYATVFDPSADTIDDIWMGIKPTGAGTASFNPVWEAESGSNGTDAADAADATAHGGNRVTISFATVPTMASRLVIYVEQILGSNYEHMIGEYLVLGRLKLTAGLTGAERIGIRLYQSFLSGGERTLTGELLLTSDNANHTNWGLYELGSLRIPAPGYRYSAEYSSAGVMERNTMMQFHAERQVSTASLYVDCFILIPKNGLVKFTGVNMAATAETMYARMLNLAAGDKTAFLVGPATQMYLIDFTPPNECEWPVDGGVVVLAAQDHNNSSLTQTCVVNYSIYPRYSLYRET